MATKKAKTTKPAPTAEQMRETVRAYLAANHPEARDVDLSIWNSGGSTEHEYKILTPPKGWKSPDPLPKKVREKFARENAEAEQASEYLRKRFVQFWCEAFADLAAYEDQLIRVCGLIERHPFTRTKIVPERVNEVRRLLHELVTAMLRPPVETTRHVPDLAAGLEPPDAA